ncbi:hypothetical protein [Bradyrhizobium sp. 170]|uniref:hypothetical protein n=1 Tax=Bradyrhizobium sp. 170 TaxID=2782641 RepID=UPI00200030EB|nr:hypothetical protein [Bradyrhizobium sp. 170]UPK08515.1 hypothetical protein IVB05_17645 [Bradyrhizobium sp. 170]
MKRGKDVLWIATPFNIRRARRDTNDRAETGSRIGSNASMTEYLIAARAVIILWTNLAVMPVEIVFDAIEAELEHRGVEL